MKVYHAFVVETIYGRGNLAMSRICKTAWGALKVVKAWMKQHMNAFPDDDPDWDLITIADPNDPDYFWAGYVCEIDPKSAVSRALGTYEIKNMHKNKRRKKNEDA